MDYVFPSPPVIYSAVLDSSDCSASVALSSVSVAASSADSPAAVLCLYRGLCLPEGVHRKFMVP